MKRLTVILALLAGPSAAAAQVSSEQMWTYMEQMTASEEIAVILVGEEGCDLSYDPEALKAYVDERFTETDTNFLASLDLMVPAAQYRMDEMGGSEKVVYCHQVERNARAFGFLVE